jgi:hypothetical protein
VGYIWAKKRGERGQGNINDGWWKKLELESGLSLRLQGMLRPLVLLAMLRDVSFKGLMK